MNQNTPIGLVFFFVIKTQYLNLIYKILINKILQNNKKKHFEVTNKC